MRERSNGFRIRRGEASRSGFSNGEMQYAFLIEDLSPAGGYSGSGWSGWCVSAYAIIPSVIPCEVLRWKTSSYGCRVKGAIRLPGGFRPEEVVSMVIIYILHLTWFLFHTTWWWDGILPKDLSEFIIISVATLSRDCVPGRDRRVIIQATISSRLPPVIHPCRSL